MKSSRRIFFCLASVVALSSPLLAQTTAPTDPLVEAPKVVVTTASAGAVPWSGRDTPAIVAAAMQDLPPLPPGPYEPTWDSIRALQDPGMVSRREVRDHDALGNFFRARASKRMVCALHVRRERRDHAMAYGALRATDEVRLQGLSSAVHRGQVGSGRLGRVVQKSRRDVCAGPRRTPRRLFQLGQRHQQVQCGQLRPAPRP